MTNSSATTSTNRTAGVAALAVAGLIDLVTAVLAWTGSADDRPPTVVLVGLVVAGLVSCASLLGGRGALIAAYAARVLSALLGIPALFLDAPIWVDVLVVIQLILSVAGIWLTLPTVRRRVALPS